MQRDLRNTNPDELTYCSSPSRSKWLIGMPLLLGGLVFVVGAFLVKIKNTQIAGTQSELLMRGASVIYGLCLVLGGVISLVRRRGITFDKAKRNVLKWTQSPRHVNNSVCALAAFDRVRIEVAQSTQRNGPATTYPLFLIGQHGVRFAIWQSGTKYSDVRAMADDIAQHTGLVVDDLSGMAGIKRDEAPKTGATS